MRWAYLLNAFLQARTSSRINYSFQLYQVVLYEATFNRENKKSKRSHAVLSIQSAYAGDSTLKHFELVTSFVEQKVIPELTE